MVTKLTPQELIDQRYYQVSRQYKTLARLPKGRTGVQARSEAVNTRAERLSLALNEDEARDGDYYLRVYSPAHDRVDVDLTTFRHYRMLGGGTYPEVIARGGFHAREIA